MALFIKTSDGYKINEACIEEEYIIDKFTSSAQEYGFDDRLITFGVSPSPDFGYFELANRYWRSSLCIYLSGCVGCFLESGIGFTESWLFNARHSFELTLKGFLLFSVWLEGVNQDLELSAHVSSMEGLRKHFTSLHLLSHIYADYEKKIESVIQNWNSEISEEPPSLDESLLNKDEKIILDELDGVDSNSFTFRYPSLKRGPEDVIQRSDWKHDETQLFPTTGLPKESGYFFDHIKAVNALHDFNMRLTNIKNYLSGIGGYIGDIQDFIQDYIKGSMSDFY